ncbi:MAG: dihydrofolate reductase family protein [Myxococcota bacterium]
MSEPRRLSVYNQVSLDGFFKGPGDDTSWTHAGPPDPEVMRFVEENARGGGALLFGRKTYEMMASFWPTPAAAAQMPVVAKRMNEMPKLVVSRSLRTASWQNTRVLSGDLVTEVRKLKAEPGPGLTILGSGSIVGPLLEAGLIDAVDLLVYPLLLGRGTSMFQGLERPVPLELVREKSFPSGKVFFSFAPKAAR